MLGASACGGYLVRAAPDVHDGKELWTFRSGIRWLTRRVVKGPRRLPKAQGDARDVRSGEAFEILLRHLEGNMENLEIPYENQHTLYVAM